MAQVKQTTFYATFITNDKFCVLNEPYSEINIYYRAGD